MSNTELVLADSSGIETYHCLCTNLVLASTHNLPLLPRRSTPSLDKAYILPNPRLPSRISVDGDESDNSELNDTDPLAGQRAEGYTVLLSLTAPARQSPVLIRRSDGFEKRWLLRCGRCKLVVGYQLDWSQFSQPEGEEARKGRREDVVYVLPGAVMTTGQMKSGKEMGDEEMGDEEMGDEEMGDEEIGFDSAGL